MMWSDYLIPAAAVAVAFAAFYFSTKATRAQAAAGTHAVDAAAYQRASEIYEDTITNLRADIAAVRADLAAARAEIRELRVSNDRMAMELRRLGLTVNGGTADGP